MFDIERWTVTRRPGEPTKVVKTCKAQFDNEADVHKAMDTIKSMYPDGYYTYNGDLAHETVFCEQRFVTGIGFVSIEKAEVLVAFYANDRSKPYWNQQIRWDT